MALNRAGTVILMTVLPQIPLDMPFIFPATIMREEPIQLESSKVQSIVVLFALFDVYNYVTLFTSNKSDVNKYILKF